MGQASQIHPRPRKKRERLQARPVLVQLEQREHKTFARAANRRKNQHKYPEWPISNHVTVLN